MATDIAFAVAIITMFRKNVPTSCLLYAGGFVLLLILFNRLGVKNLAFYLIPGAFIWYFIHHSGIHATIAGVITAFTLPTTPDAKESPLEKLEHMLVNPVNFIIIPIFALANTNITFESGITAILGSLLLIIVAKRKGTTEEGQNLEIDTTPVN